MISHIISVILIVGVLYILIKILPYNLHSHNNINNNINNNFKNNFNIPNINNNLKNTPLLNTIEHGFHDHFATKNGFVNNKLLGWRYWYLKNKTNYNVKPTGNFDDIPIRHYLDSMESTDNWFTNLYTMDIEDQIIE